MADTTKHKVLLAGRSEDMCAALCSVILSIGDLDLAWNERELEGVLRLVLAEQPDLILLSHGLVKSRFVDSIRAISQRSPSSKILVLSPDNDSRFALRAIWAGAVGYMLEDRAFEELETAIHTIMSGWTYLSPGIAGTEPFSQDDSPTRDARSRSVDPAMKTERPGGRHHARILIVDDEASIRNVLRATFESAGYLVVTAATSGEAIVALKRETPDIAFVDLVMPGGSGVQVIQAIREVDEYLPVVILTGYPDSELMHQAMAHSPFLVLAKPANAETLLETTRGALAGRAGLSLSDGGSG